MKKGSEALLIVLAIVAVVLTAVNAFVALRQVSDIARVTGYQVSPTIPGRVNLSIPTQVLVYFNRSVINWQNGSVNVAGGYNHANLSTVNLSAVPPQKIVGGTWTEYCEEIGLGCPAAGTNTRKPGIDTGLLFVNYGNVNVSVQLRSDVNWINFPGGTGGAIQPRFWWNVSEYEIGSCQGAIGIPAARRGVWENVSTADVYICGDAANRPFRTGDTRVDGGAIDKNSTLRIDFLISVPQEATGAKFATLTATATSS
jgi:hypothetical protein